MAFGQILDHWLEVLKRYGHSFSVWMAAETRSQFRLLSSCHGVLTLPLIH